MIVDVKMTVESGGDGGEESSLKMGHFSLPVVSVDIRMICV